VLAVFSVVRPVLVAMLGVAMAALARAEQQPWSVLVLIYERTEATCWVEASPGQLTEFETSASLTDALPAIELAVSDFERIVSEWSDGLGAVHVETQRVQRAVATAGDAGGGECWLRPEDAAEELDRYLPRGDYDSVVAIWDNGSFPGPLGAASLEPIAWQGKTITWSTVHAWEAFLDPTSLGPNFQDPGEAILHEWLHPVGQFYRRLGYSVPDSDDSGNYPFPSTNPDGVGGFKEFYRRLLQGRLIDSPGKYTGISKAVWAAGSLRESTRPTPLPMQLVAPPNTLCQDDDALLEWDGPPLPPLSLYEITLTDDLGGTISVQTDQDEIALSELPIQSGRTYRWTLRTSNAPAGSEVDQLTFRATGPGPAPPTFSPPGGQLGSFDAVVFVRGVPGTEIRYTLNGVDPTPGDRLVPQSGEVHPTELPVVVKARAFAPNCAPSSVTSALYGVTEVLTVTSTSDSGTSPPEQGTLRWALATANADAGTQEIHFAIPGAGVHTIDLAVPLPAITDSVIINGWTQPGFAGMPLIEIDGAATGSGLSVTAGSASIRGLIINNSGGFGLRLAGAGNHVVRGCYIGTNATGSAARANLASGILIDNVADSSIGGTDPEDRNVISGNGFSGIEITGTAARNNYVQGNYIGTDRTGTSRISNRYNGIQLSLAPRNQIGGTAPGAGNLISGNGFSGVANTGDGIAIGGPGADENVVEGNRIGTDASGSADLGNSRSGISISALTTSNGPAASGNRIGGTDPAARNLISGNDAHGISIVAVNGGAADNLVQGNFIGTDASGSFDLGNSLSGVELSRGAVVGLTASGNTIGGLESGARNLISGNGLDGITIVGAGDSPGNTVQGNYIGVDVQGIFDLGNTRSGVRLTTASAFADAARFNLIGGASHAARNVISGNDQNGIAILGKTDGGGDNRITGNFIGIGAGGGSGPGNSVDGILITTNLLGGITIINQIGGGTPGAGNVIGGNGSAGIRIEGSGADLTYVDGNRIGIDANGNPRPNGGDGIFSSGPNSHFGGNTIAMNQGAGVVVSSANGNWIHQNSIFENGGPGIDLIGGGNDSQPAPVLSSAITSGGTILGGTLAAKPDTEYTLDFFASPSCDPTGFGEGMTSLGRTRVTTSASGSVSFLAPTPAPVALGQVVTATATEFLADNTSEFSNCATVSTGPPGDPDGDQVPGDNCPTVPNPGQEDTGGLNTALPNGRGNACECGDVTEEGIVNDSDLDLFRRHLLDPGVVWTGTLLGKCSVYGANPASCNLLDVVVLRRALAGLAPGIGANCAPPPPG
jgi:hypothetical protein